MSYKELDALAKRFIMGYKPLTRRQYVLLKQRDETYLFRSKLLTVLEQTDQIIDEINKELYA